MYEETLTGRPHDTSVQKATSDNENVHAVQRHARDGDEGRKERDASNFCSHGPLTIINNTCPENYVI